MTDKTELKRLAEAANAVIGDVNVDVTISSDSGPNQAEIDAVAAFLQLATPAAVLGLFAENERLSTDEQEATDLCDRLSDLLRSTAIEVRGPEEPLKRHSFHDLPSRVKTVISERDQLKAENERLKNRTNWQAECLRRGFKYVREPDDHYVLADVPEMADLLGALLGVEVRSKENDSYEEANSRLNEQIEGLVNTIHSLESLRKDAERYRGVRRAANRQGFTDEQFDQQTDARTANFDAAMGKGELS